MKVKLHKKCSNCNTVVPLEVELEDLERYKRGEYVQVAFPYLTADEREIIISGICGSCYDDIFSIFEEEADEHELQSTKSDFEKQIDEGKNGIP